MSVTQPRRRTDHEQTGTRWIGELVGAAIFLASDAAGFVTGTTQHRWQVETRIADIDGLKLPTWQEVVAREYQPWNREHIVIDTAGRSVAESVEEVRNALAK